MKRNVLIFIFMIALVMPACSTPKKPKGGIIPQEGWSYIPVENAEYVQAYTMDEQGMIYTIEMSVLDTDCTLVLNQYDLSGKSVHSMPLSMPYPGNVQTMAYADGNLFYAPRDMLGDKACVLYSCNVNTWTEKIVATSDSFIGVTRIVPMGEEIYLLGRTQESSFFHSLSYSYDGRKLYVVNIENQSIRSIDIDEPIDMSKAGENELLLYAHIGDAFSFIKYDTVKSAFSVQSVTKEYALSYFAYDFEAHLLAFDCKNRNKLLCASLEKPDEVSEIYPECDMSGYNIACQNGNLLMKTYEKGFVIVSLSKVCRKTGNIRFISDISSEIAPYGCGFNLQHTQYPTDKLAVKVLARDNDYDICYFNSARTLGNQFKEQGVFYPLNEIPGVMEYLDSCYPYVKDAVMNSEGKVWMFPVQIEIPTILWNTAYSASEDFALSEDMTYEMFLNELRKLNSDSRKSSYISALTLYSMWNYFSEFHTVNTEEFRKLIRELQKMELLINSASQNYDIDYLLSSMALNVQWEREAGVIKHRDTLQAYSYPKMYSESKNLAMCYGIVVNPNSANKEEALEYIATLANYLMNIENRPLFFKKTGTKEDILKYSLSKIYENGKVYFGIDESLYDGYREVLNGTMDLELFIMETESKLSIYFGE